MKICVVLSSEQQKISAGARIRYQRMQPLLKQRGLSLEFQLIQDVVGSHCQTCDIYILSKCQDARSLLLAHKVKQAGKVVGVDLFDDYFSQTSDSRFVRLRHWLRSLSPICSFILCSTLGMADIARQYAPEVPVHILNDPSPPVDKGQLADQLASKVKNAQANRRLNIAWFGMGDNPTFPVGLTDLVGFGCEVDRLRGHGYEVKLEIMTNSRAMLPDRLADLKRLSTPYTLSEWSELAEVELLKRSLLAFLPVNAQSFSRVKSLNRAITALCGGTQVLSAGFPLYSALGAFVYRDYNRFINDLNHGQLALSHETLPAFLNTLQDHADVKNESERCIQFLESLEVSKKNTLESPLIAVIHGKKILGDVHKFAQKQGVLSVASPFCSQNLNFDARIQFTANVRGGLDVLVSNKKMHLIAPEIQGYFRHYGAVLSSEYLWLNSLSTFPEIAVNFQSLASNDSPAANAVSYPLVMSACEAILQRIFPGIGCVLSEESKSIPWHCFEAPMKSFTANL
jgi:hypothetical protein